MNYKLFARILLSGAAASLLLALLFRAPRIPESLSNGTFLTAMGLLFFGLFRLTRKLGFYDIAVYGMKKLSEVAGKKEYNPRESELGSYHDYQESHPYTKPWREFCLSGLIFLLVSLLFALISTFFS